MKCEHVRPMLSGMLDGELAAKDQLMIEEHISACGSCQNHLAELTSLMSALGSHLSLRAPRDFSACVMQAVTASKLSARKTFLDLLIDFFQPGWRQVTASAAGAFLIVYLVFTSCGFARLAGDTTYASSMHDAPCIRQNLKYPSELPHVSTSDKLSKPVYPQK